MDKTTLDYYSKNASEVAKRYEEAPSAMAKLFDVAFPIGGKVLDVGCGSGRDLSILTQLGYEAYGIEPTDKFVQIAQQTHPELVGRVKVGHLPTLGKPFGGNFDGILCCAVLMHMDELALEESIESFKLAVKPHARILISVPSSRPDADQNGRDQHGRLFKSYSSEFLKTNFEKHGFRLLNEWGNVDSLQRSGIEWLTQLYLLTH